MDIFLCIETSRIPSDPEIYNKPICMESSILYEKPVIDVQYKNVQYLIPNTITKQFSYFKYAMTINAYKHHMVAYMFRIKYEDACKLVIKLTWENLFMLNEAISSPRDIALLVDDLKKPPNWTFMTWLMSSRPNFEIAYINSKDLTDVRLYQPYVVECHTRRIAYYNYGDITLLR
ncbi:Orf127 [Heliothis zea nudivirus]|uniref:Uncharacterized protein n=2 Tax=Betanudivirus hezeae TaxID=3052000 RepID=G9I048_HZNV2|nr:Orf127 [Heliothis zea nudivirus]YP_004956770.1 orf22 gene product [Helicoverpa zea nudivirus 2]AAN04420.1 Orf127 [Heliothis zea nudivirus]AEW69571.1 hypothetical protein Hz2V022 [Helicoverpa zea nudivirus 2]